MSSSVSWLAASIVTVELPDRKGKMKPAVDSGKLVGTTVDWFGGRKYKITADKTDWKANPGTVSIKDWVEMQLPNAGLPEMVNGNLPEALRSYRASLETVEEQAADMISSS